MCFCSCSTLTIQSAASGYFGKTPWSQRPLLFWIELQFKPSAYWLLSARSLKGSQRLDKHADHTEGAYKNVRELKATLLVRKTDTPSYCVWWRKRSNFISVGFSLKINSITNMHIKYSYNKILFSLWLHNENILKQSVFLPPKPVKLL